MNTSDPASLPGQRTTKKKSTKATPKKRPAKLPKEPEAYVPPAVAAYVTTAAAPVATPDLTLSIPYHEIAEGGYCRRRVDLILTGGQARKLKSIQLGLESKSAALMNGRQVSTPGHAIAWMIENAG